MSDRANTDRRNPAERRSGKERRRGGEGRQVVLHLCRHELHMGLIVREADGSPELLHTKTIAWREQDEQLPAPEAIQSLTQKLKQLVSSERVSGCPTSLVLNGELCVTRTTAGSSSDVDRALEELEDRGQLYLSLGAGAKTLVASRSNLDARHEQAVVSVACEATIDRVIDAINATGLELRCIEAETVALARAHGALHEDQDPVLLVQFDGDGFEIVVAHRGQLLLDYRPGGGVRGTELHDVLAEHHARLQRFCQRRLGDYELKVRRVYLAGDPDRVSSAEQALLADGSYQASAFDLSTAANYWQRPCEGMNVQHAILLGRALEEIDAGGDMPAPNLMERWIAESRKHIRPILLRAAAPIAATLLIAASMAILNWRVGMTGDVLQTQISQLQPAHTEYQELRLKLMSERDKLTRLKQLKQGAPEHDLTGVVTAIGSCLPDDVWLSRLTISDFQEVEVAGASYSEGGVYDFVRYLNLAPTLDQVALEGTGVGHTQQGPSTTFQLNFKLAPEPSNPQGVASK